jgi:hypothetical protein
MISLQGNLKVLVSGGQKSPFKKGEGFEMICFSLNTKPKFPPFLKGA